MGPLITAAHREKVAGMVARAPGEGGRIVTGGAAGDDVFTLPTGYRPASELFLPIAVDGAVAGNVEVDSDGTITPLSTDATPTIGLDGITFRAGS